MGREITTYPETRDDWLRLIPALLANAAEIPHLEAPRIQLEGFTIEVSELLARQAALSASKQEVSRRLQALMVEGRRLAAFLRSGIKQKYGPRSEKLTEFNLQPFRGRKRTEEKKGRRGALPVEAAPESPKTNPE
jgi:hypothetical protein